jgi:hypothetical protein
MIRKSAESRRVAEEHARADEIARRVGRTDYPAPGGFIRITCNYRSISKRPDDMAQQPDPRR